MPKKAKVRGKGEPTKAADKAKSAEWKPIEGKVPYLETNIDKFYEMVKKKESVSFLQAASEFDVSKDQIALWARILEDHKLAMVHYPVFGSPVVYFKEKVDEKTQDKRPEKSHKANPKIIFAIVGGLMAFIGYVMVVPNTFTLSMRIQIGAAIGNVTRLLEFLPFPLRIIVPAAVLIAAGWGVFGLVHRRKRTQESENVDTKRTGKKEGGK